MKSDVIPQMLGVVLRETESPMVEEGDDGGVDRDPPEVGDRAPVLQGVEEALQMAVLGGPPEGSLVPTTAVLVGVAETLQVAVPGGPSTGRLVPTTSPLMGVAETL